MSEKSAFDPESESVKKLTQQLYSKKAKLKEYERRRMVRKPPEVDTSWHAGRQNTPAEPKPEIKPMTVFSKLLIMASVFFAFSLAAAFMVFYYGQNQVSYEQLELSILGPNSVAGGETLSFDVNLTNSNDVDIEIADISVTYPRGTVSHDDGLPITQDSEAVENLQAGTTQVRKFKAVLFGREGEPKDIKVAVQYKPKGADRILFKERIYQVQVDSAPVVIDVDHQNSYLSGSNVDLTVIIRSNALKAVSNLLLEVDYPFGFEYASSSLDSIAYDNTFLIGTLRPGEELAMRISGTIVGQDDENRSFRYTLGTRRSDAPTEIGSVFSVADSNITIAKPAIGLRPSINQSEKTVVNVAPGQSIAVDLAYVNNLASKIFDATITAKIEGNAYDKKSFKNQTGFFSSADNSIEWNRGELSELVEIAGGGSEKVRFDFKIWPTETLAGLLQDPELRIAFEMSGTIFDESGEEKQVSVTESRRIKVASKITLDPTILHTVGPLENIGSLPPVAEEEVSYTVHWQLANSTNQLEDVVVKTILPSGVFYRNQVVPENAALRYDPRSREMIWEAGILPAATGYTTKPKEIYFQIGTIPSVNQIGQRLDLLGETTVEGVDVFTGLKVRDSQGEMNSLIEEDPGYQDDDDEVIE